MSDSNTNEGNAFANPYISGIFLGLVLLASFLILGAGLGASSAMARLGAFFEKMLLPARTLSSEYFGSFGENPLNYYLVYMFIGAIIGGLFSAKTNRRMKLVLEKGKRAPEKLRVIFALSGGFIAGFASRLAGGCTSGQALSGGALLLTGSLLFMGAIFAGGYATAFLFRRQWHD